MKQHIREALSRAAARNAMITSIISAGSTEKEARKVALCQFMDDLAKITPAQEAEQAAAYREAYDEAKQGHFRKANALCEALKETINNLVTATTSWGLFAETRTLGDGQWPEIENTEVYEMEVRYADHNGKTKIQKISPQNGLFNVPLRELQTDRVEYFVSDVYRGDLSAEAQKTFDLAADKRRQMDKNIFTLLNTSPAAGRHTGGVFGAFSTATGQPLEKVFKLGKAVNSAMLPTTNILTPADFLSTDTNGAATLPRFGALGAVVQYCDQWGDGAFSDGPLRPTGIVLCPSIHAAKFLTGVSPHSARPTELSEGLLKDYKRFEYGGVDWTIVPDSTLPTAKDLYPVLNKPAIIQYLKPSQDKALIDPGAIGSNRVQQWMKFVQGLVAPTSLRLNAVKVTYQTS